MIGMPHYREKLLSAWPDDQVYEVGFLPAKVDPEVLKTMLPAQIGYRAVNPRKTLRNQVHRTRLIESSGTIIVPPQFLSEKARNAEKTPIRSRRITDAVETLPNTALAGSTKAEGVPVMYRNVEIKYSKFGIDDFDFQ